MDNKQPQQGQSMLEIILAMVLFSIIGIFIFNLVYSAYLTNLQVQEQTIAQQLAQESFEALQSLRNQGWNNLIEGTYGLTDTTGTWQLVSTPDTHNTYQREVHIDPVFRDVNLNIVSTGTPDPTSKKITTTISWEKSGKQKQISLAAYLCNWLQPRSLQKDFRALWHVNGPTYSGAVEIMQNASFETYTGSAPKIDFANWDQYTTFFDFDIAPGYSSTTALKATIWGIIWPWFLRQIAPTTGIVPHTLSFWIRGNMRLFGDPGVKIAFYRILDSSNCGLKLDGSWQCTGLGFRGDFFPIDFDPSQPTIWLHNSRTFTTRSGISSVRLEFLALGDFDTYLIVDDVSIVHQNEIVPDETSYNHFGNRLPTTSTGPSYVAGRFGQALQFDGVNDYVEIPSTEGFNITEQLTLEAWVLPHEVSSSREQNLISKWDTATNNKSYRLYLSTPDRYFHFALSPDGQTTYQIQSLTQAQQGQWYHVIGVYTGTEMRLYVNGTREATLPYNQKLYVSSSTTKVKLGTANNNQSTDLFQGIIDEISLQAVGITDSQVTDHYNNSPLQP